MDCELLQLAMTAKYSEIIGETGQRRLGVGEKTIHTRLVELGLHHTVSHHRWVAAEDRQLSFLINREPPLAWTQIAEIMGMTVGRIKKRADKLGFEKIPAENAWVASAKFARVGSL